MAFIDDFKAAIEAYPTSSVKTEIIGYTLVAGAGAVLNVGEVFEFKVRVTNESHLNMKNVRVRVNGTAFADVALSTGSFASSQMSGTFNLDAHQQHTTGIFRGKAKATTAATTIVTARVNEWDANLDHILLSHSGAGAAEGLLSKGISPE